MSTKFIVCYFRLMKFWLCLFWITIGFYSAAQSYELKAFSIADGLPQSQVYDITEDHNGNLWLGTRGGGVAKFDGVDFKVFTTQDGLVSNFVSTVFHDSRDNIWIGTSKGVSLYNGIRFRNFMFEEEAFKVTVSSITESKKKELFFGTTNGVYKRVKKKNKNISKQIGLPGNAVTEVYVDSLQRLWITHNKGFSVCDNGVSKHFANSALAGVSPQCIVEGKNNTIWVGTYGKGLIKTRGDGYEFIEETNGLIVLDVFFERGKLWMSTFKNGVLVYDIATKEVKPIEDSEHLPTKNCRVVFKDSWGGKWIGTSGGGLLKYSRPEIKSFSANDGIEGKYIYAVSSSLDSGVWLSTNSRKLYKYSNGEAEEYGLNKNIYPQKIKAILEDSQRRLWIGTEGSGVMLWKDGETRFFKEGKYLGSDFVTDIVEDKEGDVWVSTSNGISRFSADLLDVQFYTKGNRNIHFNRVNCLHVDRSNRVWYGTRGRGVGCIQDSGYVVVDKKKGLSDNVIRDLAEDKLGNLFLATADAGVDAISLYAKTRTIHNLSSSDGLSFNNVYSVHCDDKNQLWLGGAKGVNRVMHPLRSDQFIKSFGATEGFTGMETNQGAVCEDIMGNIWWGTIDGVMMKPSVDLKKGFSKPKISISSVNLFYKNIQGTKYEPHVLNWFATGSLIFDFKDNHVGFVLDGNDLARPEDIRFKWRLDGGDGRWSPIVQQSEVFFSNLSPGHYIFQAKAVNKDGIESDMLEFYFAVAAPFYYKIWFWLLVFAGGGSLTFFLVRRRIKGIKQKAYEVSEKLRLEKEVLEMEQKALRLQMNPHFIFNALNAIQDQIREEDNKGARHSLSKFSKLMRQILDSSRTNYISLERELIILENYLSIEKLTRNNTFDYVIKVGPAIDPEEEGIPPMMIQPFLENAIIHGIAGLQKVGKIELSFSSDDEYLEVSVKDNGVGRKKAAALKAQMGQQHKSVALEVIQSRLDNLSTEGISSSYVVEDVMKDGEVAGTNVVLRVKRQVVW